MLELNQIYKCSVCGNMAELVHVGGGIMSCCGAPMVLQVENTSDGAIEKHVPVIEKTENGVKVKVGSVAHPMEEDHFIELIEVITEDGKVLRKHMKAGEAPEAEFCIGNAVTARAYCNIHGLWKS